MKLLLVSTWFQLAWFVAVLGQNHYLAILVGMALAAVAIELYSSATFLGSRVIEILVVAFCGITIDSINTLFGVFQFSGWGIPLWLGCLWFMFAWYAKHLHPIAMRYSAKLVLPLFGVGGALSYLGGQKLEAVSFGYATWITLLILFIEWVVIAALILKVFKHDEKQYAFAR